MQGHPYPERHGYAASRYGHGSPSGSAYGAPDRYGGGTVGGGVYSGGPAGGGPAGGGVYGGGPERPRAGADRGRGAADRPRGGGSDRPPGRNDRHGTWGNERPPTGRSNRGAGGGSGGGRGGGPPGGRDSRGDGAAPRRPRRRTPVWAVLLVVFGSLLATSSAIGATGANVMISRYTDNVSTEDLLGEAAADPGEALEGPINMLLFGVDEQGEGVRSDTIIVLHVPSTHDAAYLISVPRDTHVTHSIYSGKINGAFEAGANQVEGEKEQWRAGAQQVSTILHDMTGLRFNGAAIINFDGFEKIIDALGGIEYCVDDPATSEHYVLVNGERMKISKAKREGHWNYQEIRYEEGCHHLKGWQVLDYVRQRKNLESGDGDYGRQRNQQRLLTTLVGAAASRDVVTNFEKLDNLMQAAGDAVIVDTNGVDLMDYLFTVRNVRPDDLVMLRTNSGEYNSDQVGGVSVEILTEESQDMFDSAADDTMARFVVNHPDFVGTG